MTRRPSAGEIIENFTSEINNNKINNINVNGDNHVKIKLQRNPSTPAPTPSTKLEKLIKAKSLPATSASQPRSGIPPLSKVQNNSIYSTKSTKSNKSAYSTHSGYSSGYTQKTDETDSTCSAEHDDHEDKNIHCSRNGLKKKRGERDGQKSTAKSGMYSFDEGTAANPSFLNSGDAGERLHRHAQSFREGDRDRGLGRQGSGNSSAFASARRGSDSSLNGPRGSGRKYGGFRGSDVLPELPQLDSDGGSGRGHDGMSDKLKNYSLHRSFNEEEFQRPRISRQRNSYQDRQSHQDLSYANNNTHYDRYDRRNHDHFDHEFNDDTSNVNEYGNSQRQRSFRNKPNKFSQSSSDILDGPSRRRSKHRSKSRDFGRSHNATSSGSDWDDRPDSNRRPRNSGSNINNNYNNNNERNHNKNEKNKRRSNFSIDNRRASTESNSFPHENFVRSGPSRQGSGSALFETAGPGSSSTRPPPPPPPPSSRVNNSSSNGNDPCRNNNNSSSNNADSFGRTVTKGLKNDINNTNDNNINTSNVSTYRVDKLADRLINFSKRSSVNNELPRTSNANTTVTTTIVNSSAEGILKNPPPPPPRRGNDDDNNNDNSVTTTGNHNNSGPSSSLNSNSNMNWNSSNSKSNTAPLAPNSPLPFMEEEVNDNSSFIEHVFAGVGAVINTTSSAEFNSSFTSLSISNGSSIGNSGINSNNAPGNNKAAANNNSNGSHPTTPIETMAPRPVRISQFIDLDEKPDDHHHFQPGSGNSNSSNPSTPTTSIINASTLTSTIQNQQQQQHGNVIATKITVDNSDALPSTCDKKGRCIRHPMVKLYKKKLLGGFEMIRDVCPKCEEEAPYEDLWKKRSRNVNNNGGNIAVNSTPVRNRERDENVVVDSNNGNGNNRDDSVGDGDSNNHYDESQNSPFPPMHTLDSETHPQAHAPNSANRPKRLSRLANASFEISTTNSSKSSSANTRQRSASAGRASSIGRKSSRVGGSSLANESRAGDMASEIVSGHSLLDKGLGKLSKIHIKAMSHLNEGVNALTEKKANDKYHVFDRKTGRCLRHPSIILAKKSTFKKGWDYVQPNGNCPLCLEAEVNASRRSASRGKKSKGEKLDDDRGSEYSFSQDQTGGSGSDNPYRRKGSEDLSFMNNIGAISASPKMTPKGRVATVAEGGSFHEYGNDGLIMDCAPSKETTMRSSKKLNKSRRSNSNANESNVDVTPYSTGNNNVGSRSSRVFKMPYNTPWGESGWYTGEINEEGVPHGQGRMRFKTGNSFEGQWVDGYSEQFLENRGRLKKGFGTNVAPWKQNAVEKNSPLTNGAGGGRGVVSTSKTSSMPAPPFSNHQERSRGKPFYPQPLSYPPHQTHYRPGPVPPPPVFEQQNYPPQYPPPHHQGGMMPPYPPQSQPPPQQQWYGGEGGNVGHPAYPPGFHPTR